MTLKEQIDNIQTLIEQVNKGNEAFWYLVQNHPDMVRTKLGKDVNLKYLTHTSSIRTALGNDLELAMGEKKP